MAGHYTEMFKRLTCPMFACLLSSPNLLYLIAVDSTSQSFCCPKFVPASIPTSLWYFLSFTTVALYILYSTEPECRQGWKSVTIIKPFFCILHIAYCILHIAVNLECTRAYRSSECFARRKTAKMVPVATACSPLKCYT